MSETYTIGGDSWQPLAGFDIVAQTFTPLVSHMVAYFDADLWLRSTTAPEIALTNCDAAHEPTYPILAYGHAIQPLVYLPPAKRRVRFKLDTPILLEAGQIYSIWVYRDIDDIGAPNLWLFDRDDATYPRGHIIFSDDGGNTWIHFPNSDFIFCEFGLPPLPKPEPPPPINNFAPIDIEYFQNLTSTTINLPTNVPCHLTCYYTDKKPLKHHTSRIVRGLEVPWGVYFCFVAWKAVEQNEAGDTLYHTFEIPDWSYCQTRWFTFRGTVNEVLSPSVGPIFEHHPIAPPAFYYDYIPPTEAIGFYGRRWHGQTFRVPSSYILRTVTLRLSRKGLPGNMALIIRQAPDHTPVLPDLSLGTTDLNTLPPIIWGEWRTITLYPPLRLYPEFIYSIIPTCPDGDTDNELRWRVDSHNPTYNAGIHINSPDTGVTWNLRPGEDFWFDATQIQDPP